MNQHLYHTAEAFEPVPGAAVSQEHRWQTLVSLFDNLFAESENTRLIRGDNEPEYLPADATHAYHRVIFAHGFFASALHEIAHWCIAGKARRQLPDYGYWYCADGRNAQQQAEFEQVEVKPQAIEWAFSMAAGISFKVSTDNLDGVQPNRQLFSQRVMAQANIYLAEGFPVRAQRFIDALRQHYQTAEISIAQFQLEENYDNC